MVTLLTSEHRCCPELKVRVGMEVISGCKTNHEVAADHAFSSPYESLVALAARRIKTLSFSFKGQESDLVEHEHLQLRIHR